MKTALVCGAGGFIGGHLVQKLKREGYWVRGVDIKQPAFGPTCADEFFELDLRRQENCGRALLRRGRTFDEVYQLAADMGGMGFIEAHELDIVRSNALININMTDVAARAGVGRYFFSSSACVYREMADDPVLNEDGAYPAFPDNEYGWEKLYAERVAMTYGRHYDMKVRIARFENCYGPYGTWRGGREKAPAAICRKVAMAEDGGTIEVWGDGTAVRSFTWIDDLVDAVYILMQSGAGYPVNIASEEPIMVNELVDAVIAASGKNIKRVHVEGPVGVQVRYISAARMRDLGWRPKVSLADGIRQTYQWIEEQVHGQITFNA